MKNLILWTFLRGLKDTKKFFKNPLGKFLSTIHLLTAKLTEHSDVRILRYHVTDGQRKGRDSLVPFSANLQGTKNLSCGVARLPTVLEIGTPRNRRKGPKN